MHMPLQGLFLHSSMSKGHENVSKLAAFTWNFELVNRAGRREINCH